MSIHIPGCVDNYGVICDIKIILLLEKSCWILWNVKTITLTATQENWSVQSAFRPIETQTFESFLLVAELNDVVQKPKGCSS